MAVRVLDGRMKMHLAPHRAYMRGAYPSFAAAMASQPSRQKIGYDHAEIVEVESANMSVVTAWDYPVLFWLQRLAPQAKTLIDAGGHIGTKYRAFRALIDLRHLDWLVLDLPSVVEAGAKRAAEDGLENLRFESDIGKTPAANIVLASGLLQYYPHDLSVMLRAMPALPQHLLVNKVATRDGPSVFTMEQIGPSRVPYQFRNRAHFIADVASLGYEMVDQWEIAPLAHTIDTHPELGASTSRGFYFRLSGGETTKAPA